MEILLRKKVPAGTNILKQIKRIAHDNFSVILILASRAVWNI